VGLDAVDQQGTSPTVREAPKARFNEPSLTVGLVPGISATASPHDMQSGSLVKVVKRVLSENGQVTEDKDGPG
jgi:hypothetical protein